MYPSGSICVTTKLIASSPMLWILYQYQIARGGLSQSGPDTELLFQENELEGRVIRAHTWIRERFEGYKKLSLCPFFES